jgi:preprotein translocase subunit Sec61beta
MKINKEKLSQILKIPPRLSLKMGISISLIVLLSKSFPVFNVPFKIL